LALDSGNQELLLLLAIAYSYCDEEKAREIGAQLPYLGSMDGIDAEELEKLPGMICFLFIY
jgi:hypothetical protein